MSTCQEPCQAWAPEAADSSCCQGAAGHGAIRLSEDSSKRDGGGECGADVSAKCCRSSEGSVTGCRGLSTETCPSASSFCPPQPTLPTATKCLPNSSVQTASAPFLGLSPQALAWQASLIRILPQPIFSAMLSPGSPGKLHHARSLTFITYVCVSPTLVSLLTLLPLSPIPASPRHIPFQG